MDTVKGRNIRNMPNKRKESEITGDRLTEKQKSFADNVLFLDITPTESARNVYIDCTNDSVKRIASDNMKNRKILDYMSAVRKELEDSLLVDRFYVVKKLKHLCENGSENIQLKSAIELGKIRGMYIERIETNSNETPQEILKKSFEKKFKIINNEDQMDGTND